MWEMTKSLSIIPPGAKTHNMVYFASSAGRSGRGMHIVHPDTVRIVGKVMSRCRIVFVLLVAGCS